MQIAMAAKYLGVFVGPEKRYQVMGLAYCKVFETISTVGLFRLGN